MRQERGDEEHEDERQDMAPGREHGEYASSALNTQSLPGHGSVPCCAPKAAKSRLGMARSRRWTGFAQRGQQGRARILLRQSVRRPENVLWAGQGKQTRDAIDAKR